MCKNLIMGPAKLIEVSLEGYFKDSITRKRWLGYNQSTFIALLRLPFISQRVRVADGGDRPNPVTGPRTPPPKKTTQRGGVEGRRGEKEWAVVGERKIESLHLLLVPFSLPLLLPPLRIAVATIFYALFVRTDDEQDIFLYFSPVYMYFQGERG